jgi:hypothetical protein
LFFLASSIYLGRHRTVIKAHRDPKLGSKPVNPAEDFADKWYAEEGRKKRLKDVPSPRRDHLRPGMHVRRGL